MKNQGQVHRLSGHVIDKIAAGEVVERPAQLLKELVENSLDAGSVNLTLSVNSTLSQLVLEDDGQGILKVDLPLIFERHSTSKIKEAEELFSLSSFGFRGEALSAIGAVAKISVETKHAEDKKGSLYIWEQGQEKALEESGRDKGTRLTVSQLFESTPARKKFLKSQRYELSMVKKVWTSFALRHFEKSFKYSVDGELKFFYPQAKSIEERYSQIFPNKKVYKIDLSETSVFLEGSALYLEEPSIDSKSSSSLWAYVQSRFIQDKTIATAVRVGLNTYLMHGCFPRGVVTLNLAPDFVDVNVHPMKSEVRYQNSGLIYKTLRQATSQWAARAPWQKPLKESVQSYQNIVFQKDEVDFDVPVMTQKDQVPFVFSDQKVKFKKTFGDLKPKEKIEKLVKYEGFEPMWSSLDVIGQVNATYIVAQSKEGVYFIDQHAAHERVGYEKLYQSWKKNQNVEVQNLLLPLSLDLLEEEAELLMEEAKNLKLLGVHLEQTGPGCLSLQAVPNFLKEEALDKALRKLAQDLKTYGGGSSLDEVFELFFATVACHSVIRAGHAMAPSEMELLLVEMDKYKSNYCPHGRPVYVKLPFSKLDLDFGRRL